MDPKLSPIFVGLARLFTSFLALTFYHRFKRKRTVFVACAIVTALSTTAMATYAMIKEEVQ